MRKGIRFLAITAWLAGTSQAASAPDSLPGSPFGICWGMVYGRPFTKAETFMPQVRRLNAGFARVILFWSQLEPAKGQLNWETLDAWLDQLESPEEAILTIYSSSPWATRIAGWAFPPSPARDPDDYSHFITALAKHVNGRIRYFQNGSEPNNPMFWSGTKEEYAEQLQVFARAVRVADPKAKIVLGGSDGLFDLSGKHAIPGQDVSLAWVEHAIAHSSADFDIFDLHLYADTYTIPARVNYIRGRMEAYGYQKPIIAAESNGPGFFELSVNRKYFRLMSEFGAPNSEGVAALYAEKEHLASETQMFMQGSSPELDAKLQRLQERDLIIRTVLALSAGVQKIAFWDLWHETERRDQVKTLLYGKLQLMSREEGVISRVLPLGEAYQRLASRFMGVETVERVTTPDESDFVFLVRRRDRVPLYVAWSKEGAVSKTIRLYQGVVMEVGSVPVFLEVPKGK